MALKEFQPAEITIKEYVVIDILTTSSAPGFNPAPPEDNNDDMF